jgi:hypothetical protein
MEPVRQITSITFLQTVCQKAMLKRLLFDQKGRTLSYGRGLVHRRFASGGHAEATPGADTAQRRSTSDKTVAHCTFFTNRGIMVVNSDLPKE